MKWHGNLDSLLSQGHAPRFCQQLSSRHYHVLSFLINGQLYADYVKLAGMLGFPSCAGSTWQTIVKKLEVHVSQLAEWSCTQVREAVKARKDDKKWIASFDGF